MKTTFKILVVILAIMTSNVYAEVKPYTKVGGMELVEHNISEGHKAYTALGIDISQKWDKVIMKYTLEGWSMIEAVDDDPEMPQAGFKVSAEVKTKRDKIQPFVSLDYNSWDRDVGSFTTLHYLNSKFGVDGKWNILYTRVGGTYPIWNETNSSDNMSGKLGFVCELGFKWKKVSVGYIYERTSFTDLETNFSGVKIGYTF